MSTVCWSQPAGPDANRQGGSTSPATAPRTRAEEIEQQRRAKSTHLEPDLPPKAERIVRSVEKNVLNPLFGGVNGWRATIGGLYPRSGFAAGPEYYRPDLVDGRIQFRSSVRASFRKYTKADMQLTFPHLASDHMIVDLLAVYRNYPSIDYYGPGPNSVKTGRSNYRFEQTAATATVGLMPFRFFSFGGTGGYMLNNVGPGTDDRFVSTDKIYQEWQAPGIQHQADYLTGGPFLQIDYRDRPGDPHAGGFYRAEYLYFKDTNLHYYDFERLNAEVNQYIPFLNQKRVIQLRGRTELSYRNSGVPIPFYMQPRLGGSDDLRGYRVFRYYDDNSLLLQAEYRWEILTGFDMALFADSGKVFRSKKDLNVQAMQFDAGFGLRFSSKNARVMRCDVGFSREGFQVWIKFGGLAF